jgi:hypothetical protein
MATTGETSTATSLKFDTDTEIDGIFVDMYGSEIGPAEVQFQANTSIPMTGSQKTTAVTRIGAEALRIEPKIKVIENGETGGVQIGPVKMLGEY